MSIPPTSIAFSLAVAGSVAAVVRSILNATRNAAPAVAVAAPAVAPTLAHPAVVHQPAIVPAVSADTNDGNAPAPPAPAGPVPAPQVLPAAALIPPAAPIVVVPPPVIVAMLVTYANALVCLRRLADVLMVPRLSMILPAAIQCQAVPRGSRTDPLFSFEGRADAAIWHAIIGKWNQAVNVGAHALGKVDMFGTPLFDIAGARRLVAKRLRRVARRVLNGDYFLSGRINLGAALPSHGGFLSDVYTAPRHAPTSVKVTDKYNKTSGVHSDTAWCHFIFVGIFKVALNHGANESQARYLAVSGVIAACHLFYGLDPRDAAPAVTPEGLGFAVPANLPGQFH